MNLDLADRVIIVTGSSRGIGAATVKLLAEEGARLVLSARDEAQLRKLAADFAPAALIVASDLTAAGAVEALVAAALAKFGRIDGLVNCAGATSGGDPLALADAAWRNSFELKFFTTLRLIQAVLPTMQAQKRGVVVTVAGNIGRQPNPFMLPGSAVGAALHAVNKGLADVCAKSGVRFHILNPGPTRTERLVGYTQMLAKQGGITAEQAEQQLVKDAPQGRVAEPAEMAALIAFMLSDRFSTATGNSITADGGWVKAAS
jgi:NAD(P)-dependent dehydrogenase (short-subunit alcohol dehydrogenase family)